MPVTNIKGEKIRLADYTWDELESRQDRKELIFVQTIGATEEHGYHLPMGTDTYQAVAVAEAAAKKLSNVIVMPEIPYSYCLDTMSFCGTVTFSAATVISMVGDIAESVCRHGFGKLVLFNGHGGNKGVLETALRDSLQRLAGPAANLRRDFRMYLVNAFATIAPQLQKLTEGKEYGHACELETSLMLLLDPDLVKMERAVEEYMQGDPDLVWMVRDMKEASVSGIHGAATLGTREKGGKIFNLLVDDLENFLRRI